MTMKAAVALAGWVRSAPSAAKIVSIDRYGMLTRAIPNSAKPRKTSGKLSLVVVNSFSPSLVPERALPSKEA